MDPKLKTNLLNLETYQRFALMVIFVIFYSIAELIVYAVALFQIIYLLFTGSLHEDVKTFGRKIGAYVYDIIKYLTFERDTLPFPFEPWNYGVEVEAAQETPAPKAAETKPAPKPRKPRAKKTSDDETQA